MLREDSAAADAAAALALLDREFQGMPPVAAMALRAARFDATGLQLTAPLAANVNDKGCAFGGSLASAMTLSAWGYVTARLHALEIGADVFVADSQIRYLLPVYEDILACTPAPDAAAWARFLQSLRERGRGRIEMSAEVRLGDGRVAATLQARFAALQSEPSAPGAMP